MVNCQKIVKKLYKKCQRIVSGLQHLRSLPEGAPSCDYGAERWGGPGGSAVRLRCGTTGGQGVGVVVRLRCGTEEGNRGWPSRNGRGQRSWGNHVTTFLNDSGNMTKMAKKAERYDLQK